MSEKINIIIAAQTNSAIKGLDQVSKSTQRVGRSVQTAQSKMGSFNKGVTVGNTNMRKFAMGGLQQAGYQVGDFAVQVANGTSKMQAFGQQSPQLLQIFGPIGAVVGAAVAIFAAFGVAVQKSGKEVQNLSSTLGVLQEPLMSVKDSIMSVKDAFGSALPFIVRNIDTALIAAGLFAAVVGVKMVKAMVLSAKTGRIFAGVMVQVRAAVVASALSAGRFSTVMVAARSATLLLGGALKAVGAILMRFLPIAVLLGAAKLIEMFLQLKRGAGGFAIALGLLKDVALESFGRIADYGDKLYLGLQKGILNFKLTFMNSLVPIAQAFDKLASGIVDAWNSKFPEDGRLSVLRLNIGSTVADNLEDASSEVQSELDGVNSRLDKVNMGLAAPMKSLKALRDAFKNGALEVDIFGDSGENAADKLAGSINGKVSPAMERLNGILKTVEQSFENAMMSAVDGTKSTKDAFRSMASEIIKELYRVFVVKQITGFVTSAIGGYFNANQVSGPSMPLGTGNVRPMARTFAGGGYTGNGARAGGLDGRGGFMAMMHPRETVVDHTKGQGGGITVIQNNTFQSGVTRSEVSALLPRMVEASKAAVLDAKRQGGSYGKGFA